MDSLNFRYKFFKSVIKAFATLPLGMLYRISDLAAFILHRCLRYRVDVVRSNLSRAFPSKSKKELRRIELRFYRYLTDVFVESAKLAHISDEEVKRRVEVAGIEHVNNAVAAGRSVVLFLGHFGNWEWVTSSAMYMDRRAVIGEIYHPLNDEAFDKVMLHLRSRFDTENIPMADAVHRLLSIHRDGGTFVCGFISDQRPFNREIKNWTDFLGIDTDYINGGEVIGTRIGAEYVYVEMLPVKRGHYRMSFSRLKPIEDGEENPYSRAFLRRLEESIRRNPQYWLWSHNRWTRTHADR